MARREQFKMTTAERRRRHFSDSFKIQKVREIETGKTKVFYATVQYFSEHREQYNFAVHTDGY